MMRKISRICTAFTLSLLIVFIHVYWPKLLIWSLMILAHVYKSESKRGTAYFITLLSRLNRRWVTLEQKGLTFFTARIRKPVVLIQLLQKKKKTTLSPISFPFITVRILWRHRRDRTKIFLLQMCVPVSEVYCKSEGIVFVDKIQVCSCIDLW
jgi:hypothetical protein